LRRLMIKVWKPKSLLIQNGQQNQRQKQSQVFCQYRTKQMEQIKTNLPPNMR
ncbi:phage tail fiber repeat protein, partial [Haemophilus influenzae]